MAEVVLETTGSRQAVVDWVKGELFFPALVGNPNADYGDIYDILVEDSGEGLALDAFEDC